MAYDFPHVIDRKAARIRSGARFRVADLFAGAGGWSLGFLRASAEIAGAAEIDPHACRTHADAFGGDAMPADMRTACPHEFVRRHGEIDVVAGSPPCVSFSRIGRAKHAHLAGRPDAHLDDPRGDLHLEWLRFVRALAPLACAMEQVGDAACHGGRNVIAEIADALDGMGYRVAWTSANAVHFGVPQTRERIVLVAIHKALRVDPTMPAPTHRHPLPKGYLNIRRAAQRAGGPHHVTPGKAHGGLPPAPTAEEAIGDLPRLRGGDPSPPSAYALSMRDGAEWPPTHHDDRTTERDAAVFARMREGDDYRSVPAIADALFTEAAKGITDTAELDALRRAIIPPYDPGKFRDKWRKLTANIPSHTLTAHLFKDRYSHINYAEARTITEREAARLMGFPDTFRFVGGPAAAMRQIGNAVPPPVAFAVATSLLSQVRAACSVPALVVLDGGKVARIDRFAEMIARRWWPLSAAVAAASHPDLFAKPQRYADAMLERRRAGIPDMTAEQAAAHGLVMVEGRVTWMRGTFRGWVGRERAAELPAILAGIRPPVKAKLAAE